MKSSQGKESCLLFHCVPDTGGCERRNLEGFPGQFNSMFGTNYRFSRCLDVENRIDKMPELLLEAPGLTPIVLESKVVAWPRDYCLRHRRLHIFANQFAECLKERSDRFGGAPFRLNISSYSLEGLRKYEVKSLAEELGQRIHAFGDRAAKKRGVRGDQPMAWQFGPGRPEMWGEPASCAEIWVETNDLRRVPEFSEYQVLKRNAKSGYAAELDKQIESARSKFERYAGCRKLLILYFVGDRSHGITDDEFCEIVLTANMPEGVDETWVAFRDWTNEWDYEVAWKRVRSGVEFFSARLESGYTNDFARTAGQSFQLESTVEEQKAATDLDWPYDVIAKLSQPDSVQPCEDGAKEAVEANAGYSILELVQRRFAAEVGEAPLRGPIDQDHSQT